MVDEQQTPSVLILSLGIPQTRNAGASVLWRLFAGYGGQPEAADRQGKAGAGGRFLSSSQAGNVTL